MRRFFLTGMMSIWLALPVYSAEIDEEAGRALYNLNRDFINAHAVARKINLETGSPIILLRDGKLILVRDKTETAVEMILPTYDTLKVFAHMPVAIYLMLGPAGAGQLDAERLSRTDRWRRENDRSDWSEKHHSRAAEKAACLFKAVPRQGHSTAAVLHRRVAYFHAEHVADDQGKYCRRCSEPT